MSDQLPRSTDVDSDRSILPWRIIGHAIAAARWEGWGKAGDRRNGRPHLTMRRYLRGDHARYADWYPSEADYPARWPDEVEA